MVQGSKSIGPGLIGYAASPERIRGPVWKQVKVGGSRCPNGCPDVACLILFVLQ